MSKWRGNPLGDPDHPCSLGLLSMTLLDLTIVQHRDPEH